jgi:hypothetical protein
MYDYIYLGDRPIAMLTAGELFFLHGDHLDTPQIATTPTQGLAWLALYQPFGTITAPINNLTQNLRFPGQYAFSKRRMG